VKQEVALRIASSPQEAWSGAIGPWFREVLPNSWKRKLPSIVVVPTRSHAHALKARLLAERQSHLGIRFVTPAGLRHLLRDDADGPLPLREHLRLLLAIAAEQENDGRNLAAKAVLRAPDHLLRTLERIANSGWDFERLGLTSFEPIVRQFREQLRACGLSLAAEVDRELLAYSRTNPPRFAHLLIAGFDAAHWSQWFLLRAAVNAARAALVVLEQPRDNSDIDLWWIGSWEEILGEAEPVSARPAELVETFFTEDEMRGGATAAEPIFLVGADASEQAEAVARLCLHFLAEKNCRQIGIVFGAPGSLSRLVGNALERLDIPNYDGLAHLVPGPFEADEWRAWLELQRSQRIGSLLRFFNALPSAANLFPELSAPALERKLRDAYAEILIDDLAVLAEFCVTAKEAHGPPIAAAIRSLGLLPSTATLEDFLAQTEAACRRFEWKHSWPRLASRIGPWIERVRGKISRSLFLRWLEEIAFSFALERSATGDHPYARVQLLTVPQAAGQEFSRLIFAGWNEGSWPPPAHGEFMREDEIEEFNRNVRQLNRRAIRSGGQGEGHESVREGFMPYLGPAEQRRVALRQFAALRETTSEQIAIAASLIDENSPERLWNPNELLTRLYQESKGAPLTERTMARLQKATRAWLDSEGRASARPKYSSTGVKNEDAQQRVPPQQTRIAYDARRDSTAKSGEYDFSFRVSAPTVPTLSVSDFENLLAAPALVWLKKYLGVRAPEEDASVWNTSTGKWIHDWLARIAHPGEKTFAQLPDAAEIDERLRAAAREKREQVAQLCRSAGRALPDWWESGHRHALFLARMLGEKLATITDWPWLATEWKIDEASPVKVANGGALSFRGRIDLVLARQAATSLATEELWIVDYKTGAKKSLASGNDDVEKRRATLRKRLLDGSALQLGLYALAALSLGAERTFVSLLSPLVRPFGPQLEGADVAAETDIFSELARMQQTGQFGMHGPLHSAYRFTDDYPLATLAIDPDVLELRWEKTHPALVREEEDIFW
jgi:hypothetical protein